MTRRAMAAASIGAPAFFAPRAGLSCILALMRSARFVASSLRIVSVAAACALAGCWYSVADIARSSSGDGAGGAGGTSGSSSSSSSSSGDVAPGKDITTCDGASPGALGGVRGVLFDGNEYLTAQSLLGEQSSTRYTMSFWFSVPTITQQMDFFTDASLVAETRFNAGGKLYRKNDLVGGGSVTVQSMNEVAGLDSNWHHLAISQRVDAKGGKTLVYLDGDPLGVDAFGTNTSLPFDFIGNGGWGVGARFGGGNVYSGELAEFYFAVGVFVDLSNAECLKRFRTVDGHPADLGVDGSDATGDQPIVYLSLRSNLGQEFATNRGFGGNFMVVGTPSPSATSP